MRVKIGPYLNYIGPYQIAEKILFWMDKEDDRVYNFGSWLAGGDKKSWLADLCEWIYSKRKRTIKVKIERYDVWSMDHTLANIILPMLKMLKEHQKGAPCVDDEDVPEHLRSTAASPKENDWDTDDLHFDRWVWVLDEMIWAFEQKLDDNLESKFSEGEPDFIFEPMNHKDGDSYELFTGPNHTYKFNHEAYKVHMNRMQNGFMLFGKYFQNLWI